MLKKYLLSQSECKCGLADFYKNVANGIGIDITDKTHYDCRKIRITKSVQEYIWKHYSESGQTDEKIAALMLQYGPKATLSGGLFEVAIEDGFVAGNK